MPRPDMNAMIGALSDLIDREKAAILDGDFAVLAKLADRKTALVAQINSIATPQEASLLRVQEKIQRNQELLSRAMEGVRTVSARLAELKRVRDGLQTYDAQGQRQTHGGQQVSSVERRA